MRLFTFLYFAKYVGDTVWRQVALIVFTMVALHWMVRGLDRLADWWEARKK